MANQSLVVSVTVRYFRPEGSGTFMEPAEVDPNLQQLHKGTMPKQPNMVATAESELKDRESLTRTHICIESTRRWLEDAAIETAELIEKMPGMEDWGKSLAEILSTARSLSTLTLDRLTTELTNILIKRRDMWLRTLIPRPSASLVEDLRTAPTGTPFLFGQLSKEFAERELSRRKEDGILSLLETTARAQTRGQGQQEKKGQRPPPPQQSSAQQKPGPPSGDRPPKPQQGKGANGQQKQSGQPHKPFHKKGKGKGQGPGSGPQGRGRGRGKE